MAIPIDRTTLDADIVTNVFQNAQRKITGTKLQKTMLDISASMLNTISDRNVVGGFLGIDESGLIDISWLAAAVPVGYFLRDDGTYASAVSATPSLSLVLDAGNITGGQSIVLSAGDSVQSPFVDATHFDFGFGNDFNLNTKTDNSGSGIGLTNTTATFGAPNGSVYFSATTSRLSHGSEFNLWSPIFYFTTDNGAGTDAFIYMDTHSASFFINNDTIGLQLDKASDRFYLVNSSVTFDATVAIARISNPTGYIEWNTSFVKVQNNTSFAVEIGNTIMMNVAVGASSWFDFDANGSVQIGTNGSMLYMLEVPGIGGTVAIQGALLSMGDGAGNYLQMDFVSNAGIIRDDLYGVGFVYYADYSGGFVNESLITKRYADTKLSLAGGTLTGNILFTSSHGIDTTATGGSDVLNLGTSNADVINVGRAGITINILGSIVNEYATNAYVTDKLITLNYGGGAATGIGVGFEIEENSIIKGYFKTNSSRNAFEIVVPAVAYKSTLSLGNLTADHVHKLPNYDGEMISDGGSYSDPSWLTSLAWGKITLTVQNANYIFAGPSSGGAATPTFRALVAADIPSLSSIYQPLDSDLTAISALTGTGGFLKTDGAGGWSVDTSTYLTTTTAASTYQPLDSDLTVLSGLSATTDNFIVSVSSNWASRTPSQVRTTLGLVIGTNVQAYLGYTPVNVAGDTMGGYLTLNADPSSALHAATKQYVDQAVLGQNFKEAAKYATTAALPAVIYNNGAGTLTGVSVGAISTDSGSPSVGDRILVKNQVSTFQNGWYIVTATGSGIAVFVLTRTTDANTSAEFHTGDSSFVTSGTTQATTTWAYTGVDNPTLGTDAITFVQTAGQGSFVAGSGITISGTTISISASAITNSMLAGSIDLTAKVTGILPVANGGSGTSTAFTIGSVLFATTSGVYSQDNNNFYWNAGSHILSINCAGDTGGTDAINVYKQIDSFSINNSDNGFSISNARGSVGSFTENLNNDYIGLVGFYPYNGSEWTEYASIRSYVKGTTSANRGADLEFYTKADNGSLALALTIDNTQAVTFTQNFLLNNPAQTFAYTIKPAAIAASYSLTLPLLTGNDTFEIQSTTNTATSTYRSLMQAGGGMVAGIVAGTYPGGGNLAATLSGNAVTSWVGIVIVNLKIADYPTVNGKVPKLRLRGFVAANHTAPTGNFTMGLYPLVEPASSGGAAVKFYTLGTVVSGSNTGTVVTAPAADTINDVTGSDFTFPADGFYVIAVLTSATVATSSQVHWQGYLQLHNN